VKCQRCGHEAFVDDTAPRAAAPAHRRPALPVQAVRRPRGVKQGGPATNIIREIYPDRFSVDARDVSPMLTRLTRGLVCAVLKVPLPPYVSAEGRMLLNDTGPRTLEVFTGDNFKYRRVGADFEFWYGFMGALKRVG
jgi:hypothetical protein